MVHTGFVIASAAAPSFSTSKNSWAFYGTHMAFILVPYRNAGVMWAPYGLSGRVWTRLVLGGQLLNTLRIHQTDLLWSGIRESTKRKVYNWISFENDTCLCQCLRARPYTGDHQHSIISDCHCRTVWPSASIIALCGLQRVSLCPCEYYNQNRRPLVV